MDKNQRKIYAVINIENNKIYPLYFTDNRDSAYEALQNYKADEPDGIFKLLEEV
jgi:hypothetical protein